MTGSDREREGAKQEKEREGDLIREKRGDDMPGRYLHSLSLSLQEIRRLESFIVMKEKHLNLTSQKCV